VLGEGVAVRVKFDTELTYTAATGADTEAFFGRVMQELLDLGVEDPAIGVDLEKREVSMSLVAEGELPEDAVATAMGTIRAAIHAAGGATPGWPTFHFGLLRATPLSDDLIEV
jgi:hypothetical protein